MSERADAHDRWTLREFFDWAEDQDGVWELVNGVPVPKMMATPKVRHQQVVGNVYVHLRRQLEPPCRAIIELSVEISEHQTRVPDVLVDCTDPDDDMNRVGGPSVVVEVLSDSTRPLDLGDKLLEYQSIVSIRHVVFIEARVCEVRVHDRIGDGWEAHRHVSPDDVLDFSDLGVSLRVGDLYEDVSLPPRFRIVRDDE